MKIGISASAVWSQTNRLGELFRSDVQHIEIGLFENIAIADDFIRQSRTRGKSVGIHSPLVRGGSKYDLLEAIEMPSIDALEQVEGELAWCQRSGVDYLHVHFPFSLRSGTLSLPIVTKGIQQLALLQRKTGIQIVCEPKLGETSIQRALAGSEKRRDVSFQTQASRSAGT